MAKCRSCDAPMVWAKTEDKPERNGKPAKPGRMIPLNSMDGVEPMECPDANLVIVGTTQTEREEVPLVRYVAAGEGKYTTHFATCPNAPEHRRGR